jgi:hypothetical protein
VHSFTISDRRRTLPLIKIDNLHFMKSWRSPRISNIQNMPVLTSTSKMECVVCQEIYESNSNKHRTLPCQHELCSNCFAELTCDTSKTYACYNKCPLCRSQIRPQWLILYDRYGHYLALNMVVAFILYAFHNAPWRILNNCLFWITVGWNLSVLTHTHT